MRFGEMLRRARDAKGLSPEELGAGVYSDQYISLLERGERQPTPDMLRHLATVLGMDAQTLTWWVEPTSASDAAALTAAMHNVSNARDLQDDALTAAEAENAAAIAHHQANLSTWWSMSALQAQALVALRRFDEADVVLRALRGSSLVQQNSELLAVVLGRQSAVLRARGQLADAIETARAAVEAASDLPTGSLVRLEAVFVLLAALSLQGHLEEAWEIGSSLDLELAVPALPSRLVGQGAWVVGNIAFRRGEPEVGLRQHRLAAELLLARTDVESWAHFHVSTAMMRLHAGLADDEVWSSIDNARLGLQICGTDEQRQEVKIAEAFFHLRTGRPDLAGPLLAEAEETKESQDFENLSLLERLLGEYHASRGDTLRARRHFGAAIALFDEAGAVEWADEVRELMRA